MVTAQAGGLLGALFSTEEMERVFSDANQVQQMLRFEWALSAALAECGIAPASAAEPLAGLLETQFLSPERARVLRDGAVAAGNVAIPFVKMLTVAVAGMDGEAAKKVHTGATSQDVLDTALMLQVRDAMALLHAELKALLGRCAELAREHAGTVMAGRTWLQQGPPVTLGLKMAGYAAALSRHQQRMAQAEERALVLQFGGAVGTLASLRDEGLRVSTALAEKLELREPTLPWHAHRDGLAELASVLGLLMGTLGKMARDLSLEMQTEVGEAFEPAGEGRGGSSTMPHKRNPVACAAVLAAAVRVPQLIATMLSAMAQEHERGLGGWQAEWETLPEVFRLTAGALAKMRQVMDGLEVDVERMAVNLHATHGLIFAEAVSAALSAKLGRMEAHHAVQDAARRAVEEKRPLKDVLSETPAVAGLLTPEELDELFDPRKYLGSSREFVERTLTALSEAGE